MGFLRWLKGLCFNEAHEFIICPLCGTRLPVKELGEHLKAEFDTTVKEAAELRARELTKV